MKEMIDLFKVLTDENRIEIIQCLLKGETCGCTLIDKVNISQPTLSYHLKQISTSGLSVTHKEGNWIKHKINKDKLNDMIKFLENLRDIEKDICHT